MSDAGGLLANLVPSIIKILKVSKVDTCSVQVIRALRIEEGRDFRAIKEGKTFRCNSGGYDVTDSSEGSTLVFAICSLTKIFIALAMFLVFQELPDVDEDEIWNKPFTVVFNLYSQRLQLRPLPGDPTVKDLLVHRHGVPDLNDFLLAPDGTPLLSKESFVEKVPHLSGNARRDQNAASKYSNGNYVLILMLIEAITKRTFGDYLSAKVLRPLGMLRTFVSPISDTENKSNWATPYVVYEDGLSTQVQNHLSSSDSAASSVMGMHSCTKDMGILYQSFLDALRGHPPIEALNQELIGRMFSLGSRSDFISSISDDEDVGYTACGLATYSNSLYLGFHHLNRLILGDDKSTSFNLGRGQALNSKVYSQAGTITGFSCCSYLIPRVFEAVIVMTNTVGLNDGADHVSRLILQALYDLKVPKRWFLKLLPFRRNRQEKVDIVKKAQRSAKQILRRWEVLGIRRPPNVTPVRNPEKLVGQYRGEYGAQHLIITNENDQTVVTISDGRSRKSGKLVLKSLKPRLFRIIPQEPGIDVFGSWDVLELEDISPDSAHRVTRLSRTRRTVEGEDDQHYEYELLADSISDH